MRPVYSCKPLSNRIPSVSSERQYTPSPNTKTCPNRRYINDVPAFTFKYFLVAVLEERITIDDAFIRSVSTPCKLKPPKKKPSTFPRPTTALPQSVHYYKDVFRGVFGAHSSEFDSTEIHIDFLAYISRILLDTTHSDELLVLALVYIDRFTSSRPQCFLRSSNAWKLFGTAFLLAAKWQEDESYTLAEYAACLGFDLDEMISLETAFLKGLDYKLFVSESDFLSAKENFLVAAFNSPSGKILFSEMSKYRVSRLEPTSQLNRH